MAVSPDAHKEDAAAAKEKAAPDAAAAAADVPLTPEEEASDPRVLAAIAESERQERERAAAGPEGKRVREPMKEVPDEVKAVLGDGAKPTGMLRIASVDGGSGKRLQVEWAAGNKAAWFDVPSVIVPDVGDIQPASPDVWPGVPGSRRPTRGA